MRAHLLAVVGLSWSLASEAHAVESVAPAPTAASPPGFTLDAEPRASLALNPDFGADWLLALVGTFGYDLAVVKPGLRFGLGSGFCDPNDACEGHRTLVYGGADLAIPLLRRERFRLELDVGYRVGVGASTRWWHGPEGGVFVGFPAEPTRWSVHPPWWGLKLSAEQMFVGESVADQSSLLLALGLVYRLQ